MQEKKSRSYFIWEHGKPPDVVIEVVSNREGEELTRRLRGYERMRVSHYVVHDPWHLLSDATLTRFDISGGVLVEVPGSVFFPEIGLGLALWRGQYEQESAEWLRWLLADGSLVPTGAEAAAGERERAEAERERAEAESERAEAERERAEAERERAEAERGRAGGGGA